MPTTAIAGASSLTGEGGTRIPARSAARGRAARRRRPRARRRRDRARRRQARAAGRNRRGVARTIWRGSPGTSAIATPTCRSIGDRLRIRRDHVLEDMLRGLGAQRDARSRRRSIRSAARMGMPISHDHDHGHGHKRLRRAKRSARHALRSETPAFARLRTHEAALAAQEVPLIREEPRDSAASRSDEATGAGDAERRRALPADGLAVAVLSGRRLLLFQRHRMGGRGRRHHRCRRRCGAGSR